MKMVQIPHTDLRVSAISYGTVYIGTEINHQDSFRLLDAYLDLGGNFVDTARVYANWLPGEKFASEKTIGRWLSARKNRDRVILATKGMHPELETMHIPRSSRQEIRGDLEESLQYLQTDYIDFYWLHRDDVSRPVGDILHTLNDLVHEGKIRCFGCSWWTLPRIREAMDYAKSHGMQGFAGDQMHWTLAVIAPDYRGKPTGVETIDMNDLETYNYHLQEQLAFMAWSPQARGFFSKLSEHKRDPSFLADREYCFYYSEENVRRLDRVETLAGHLNRSISEIVLSYLISQPLLTIPIIGCSTLEQLNENMAAHDLQLTPEMLHYLEGKRPTF